MDKPWDLKFFVEDLKTDGLHLTEELAKVVIAKSIGFVEQSVLLTPNKVDDIAVPILEGAKPWVMSLLDKIDGQAG